MAPNVPLPTDNIYKFACLFGLALIVVAVFSFVSVYTSSLDRKIKHSEVVISLEAKTERSKAEADLLELNKRLLEITKSNEDAARNLIFVVLGLGLVLSAVGATAWYRLIQTRDDQLASLQLRKLIAEVNKLEHQSAAPESKSEQSRPAQRGDA